MKEITEKQAVDLCIRLWRWVVRTGRNKFSWPGWGTFKNVSHYCFLCEFSRQQGGKLCDKCPYYLKFGYSCFEDESPWHMYCTIHTPKDKEYAKQFLEQLKELKKGIE